MRSQKLIDVRIVGELLEHQANGDPGSAHHRLSAQNLGIRGDPIFVLMLTGFFHIKQLYHTEANLAREYLTQAWRLNRPSDAPPLLCCRNLSMLKSVRGGRKTRQWTNHRRGLTQIVPEDGTP